jgi:hypothetical protein
MLVTTVVATTCAARPSVFNLPIDRCTAMCMWILMDGVAVAGEIEIETKTEAESVDRVAAFCPRAQSRRRDD